MKNKVVATAVDVMTSDSTSQDGLDRLVELTLDTPESNTEALNGVVFGTLVAIEQSGLPLVDFPGNPFNKSVSGRSTVILSANDIDREVAIMFESGDPGKPLVIGVLQKSNDQGAPVKQDACTMGISMDGKTLVITGEREIMLRCGDASIKLTRDGKILIRGSYVLSRSSGPNRIKGGSVQIN